ncbi:MAG: hypothetical protein JWQ63_2870 [Mucilaginibacter sp.]|nr:hypothetical protein [Mucilaginibacter sp.]
MSHFDLQFVKANTSKIMISSSSISANAIKSEPDTGNWKITLISKKLSFCHNFKKMLELNEQTQASLKVILKVIPLSQHRQLIKEFKFAFASGSILEKQIKITTESGKEKWIRIIGVLYYKSWGVPDQIVGTIEDITQKINEDRTTLSIVNHELRAPLTIIKLNIQTLINSVMAGKMENNLVKILNRVDLQINCMARLMENYLNFSPNQPRIAQLDVSKFDLDQLIDIMVDEIKTLHRDHYFIKQPYQPVWINADKFRIIQVLTNYLTNAANFSPKSSVITTNILKKNTHVEVSVQDQGLGVPEDEAQKIFQKFYRSDHNGTQHKSGKGLGLYLVKEIIQQHGGTVRVEKGKERGSVFYFTIPLPGDYCVLEKE